MKSDPQYIELLQKRVSGDQKEGVSRSLYKTFTTPNKKDIYVSIYFYSNSTFYFGVSNPKAVSPVGLVSNDELEKLFIEYGVEDQEFIQNAKATNAELLSNQTPNDTEA